MTEGKLKGRIATLVILIALVGGIYWLVGTGKWDYGHGHFALWGHRYAEAGALFQKSVTRNDSFGDAWLKLGVCKAELGRNGEAVDAFKEASKRMPENAKAHYLLGIAYEKQGLYGGALDEFRLALSLDPHNSIMRNKLGTAQNLPIF